MKWKIADAKTGFSALIKKAGNEPQFIYNRDKMVAVVVSSKDYDEYQAIKESYSSRNLASVISEFSSLCSEESYTFEVPPRSNRKVFF
jgi:hypothetical protein